MAMVAGSISLDGWLIIGIPSILAQFAGYLSAGFGFLLSLVGQIWLIARLVAIASWSGTPAWRGPYATSSSTVCPTN